MDSIKPIVPYWDVQNLSNIKTPEDAAEAFEAYFLRTLLKEMRKSIPDGLFNTSFASKMYFDMFDMQIAQVMAQSDQLGLKEYILQGINQLNAKRVYGRE